MAEMAKYLYDELPMFYPQPLKKLFPRASTRNMKLAHIFQAIEETRFLKQLSFYERLFFIGNAEPLAYIRDFFSNYVQIDRNYYYDLSAEQLRDLTTDTFQFQQYQAIIIVSLEDEDILFSKVQQQLQLNNPPVLKLFSDIFINLLCHRTLLQSASKEHSKPRISYAIATTPRSGSTYLCNLLESTNVAGYPSEHLRFAVQELSRHCNFNYLKLLDNLMADRITSNRVFGTKLISHFLFELQQTKLDFAQIFKSVDKFIFLVREDKLAQAVSLVIAQETEIWHLNGNAKNIAYESKLENIKINDALLDNVAQKYNFICKQEVRLQNTLANYKIEPLKVIYEDILDNAQLQIERILDFLSIAKPEPSLMQLNSKITRMPSTVSQEIIRRYQEKK
jgi:trehalose 2-sulfotransferase